MPEWLATVVAATCAFIYFRYIGFGVRALFQDIWDFIKELIQNKPA